MVLSGRRCLAAALALAPSVLAASNSTAKCIPSDPCWPSKTTWQDLNTTLSGRVLPTKLPSIVCPEGGPGSETWAVNATDAHDVRTTLQFASAYNLKVNVNNTGHAGVGRSSTCGALYIHTGEMKGAEFHENYTPRSCPSSKSHMAATLGAGQQDEETFHALAKHNAVTVGGTFSTVGIVGWATGGGHGWLTSTYGMGADNILELEIVTPKGDILTANECQNADIFWACRGGGGGTFGVITSITMKAYPQPKTSVWFWTVAGAANMTKSGDEWWNLVASLHTRMPALNDAGFQGYYTILGGPGDASPPTIGGYFMAFDKSNATMHSAIASFLTPATQLAQETGLVNVTGNQLTHYATWIDAYDVLPTQSRDSADGPGGVISTTRLVTREALTADVDASARMFRTIGPQSYLTDRGVEGHIIAGSLIASHVPVNSALNPAWRPTTTHLIVKSSWSKALDTGIVEELNDYAVNVTGRAMRGLSPDSGCYLNECDAYEPDFQNAMYGANYARLRAIKQMVDPEGLLWCRRCVGSEEWAYDERSGRLEKRGTGDVWPNFAWGA